jgi:hypothetical protein
MYIKCIRTKVVCTLHRWPVNICIFKTVVNILCPLEGCKHILKALNSRNLYLICKHAQTFEKFIIQGSLVYKE